MERKGLSKVEILRKRQAELELKIAQAEVEEVEKNKFKPIRKACTQIQRAKTALAEAEDLCKETAFSDTIEKIRNNHLSTLLADMEAYIGKHSSDVDEA